jgi:adenylate cyclase, class 2
VRENEIKLPLVSAAAGRRLLSACGFLLHKPRLFESNTVLDSPELRLKTSGCLLRVRTVGGQCVVTFKGLERIGRHKNREEIETTAGDAHKLAAIVQRLGFAPVFRYEKYRTEYALGAGHALLDETPIGVFLELEGPARWLDRSARLLGFGPSDYITASYGRLYLQYCEGRGIAPGHMVFHKRRPKA